MWLPTSIKALPLLLLLTFTILTSSVLGYKTIIDILSEDSRFETLIVHIQRTRLVPILNKLEGGTLFAPDNDAFANYHGPDITQDILLYHLVPWMVPTHNLYHHQILESSFRLDDYLKNNTGQRILIRQGPSSVLGDLNSNAPSFLVNDARLISPDIAVNTKTIIHAVNKVLELPGMLGKEIGSR